MKEAVCKVCGEICEWLEDEEVYCHSCKKTYKTSEVEINEKKELMIDGKPATIGQEVTTCRGKAILLDWREPYSLYDDTGEVTIKEFGSKYAQNFAPCAIGGEFV